MRILRTQDEFHRSLLIIAVSYIVIASPIGKPRASIICLRTGAKSAENTTFWAFHTKKSDRRGPDRVRGRCRI